MPWAEQQRNLDLFPDWDVRFSSSPERLNRTWVGIICHHNAQRVNFHFTFARSRFEPGTSQVQVTDALPLKLHVPCSAIRTSVRDSVLLSLILPNTLTIRSKQMTQTCSATEIEEKKLVIRDVHGKREISWKVDGIFGYV